MEVLISETEVFKRYGYSRSWLQKARTTGIGPKFVKLRRKIFYPINEVELFFSSNKNSTPKQE